MKRRIPNVLGFRRIFLLLLGGLFLVTAEAVPPVEKTWTLDGKRRSALIFAPSQASATPSPVVFVFHGHGGTMQRAANSVGVQALWPEAIVVYMQGLPTPSPLVDPEGRFPGWQNQPGMEGDRDLHFFDAVLASLKHDYRVDSRHVFVTGHSNGGVFSYVLMAARPDAIAALAPSAAIALPGTLRFAKPKPVLHLAGKQDGLVRFEWQQRTMDEVRRINGIASAGERWGESGSLVATLYSSAKGTPFVMALHPGGHQLPDGAARLIVRFFQEQSAR